MSILEEQRYERKLKFFRERVDTCGYRFYKMIQERKKEIPKLHGHQQNQILQLEVAEKVIGSANTFINCLRGDHYTHDIPEYLVPEANAFKSLFYTRLAPKFVLEEERTKLLEKIFIEQVKE